jgi:hypothetical protein
MLEMSVVVAIMIAMGQLFKLYFDGRYVPILTMVIGIIAGIYYLPHATLEAGILQGIIAGLTANGFYDLTKAAKTE